MEANCVLEQGIGDQGWNDGCFQGLEQCHRKIWKERVVEKMSEVLAKNGRHTLDLVIARRSRGALTSLAKHKLVHRAPFLDV